jgi:hypothetical protein
MHSPEVIDLEQNREKQKDRGRERGNM